MRALQQEDLQLEGLPGDALDELQFGDVRLSRPVATTFTLANRSEGKHFR